MSNAQPEPSMEEILASIRRIISEDGEEEAAQPADKAAAGQKASSTPKPEAASEPVRQAPRAESALRPPAQPAPPAVAPRREEPAPNLKKQEQEAEMAQQILAQSQDDDDIIGETTAAAASKAFHTLSQTVRVSSGQGRTLEDIVTDLLRPLVKEWLDANLPAIVEEKVEDEVQRLARRRR